jgi:hypothetical protein
MGITGSASLALDQNSETGRQPRSTFLTQQRYRARLRGLLIMIKVAADALPVHSARRSRSFAPINSGL